MTPPSVDPLLRLDEAAARLRATFGAPPRVAVVLGSGLGAFAASLTGARAVPAADVGLLGSTVAGHRGEIVVGDAEGVRVACLSGRVHSYEGHDGAAAAFGVRALVRWGVEGFILTSAVGGLHAEWPTGRIVVIHDHINLLGVNPLRGPNLDAFGTRFPDMSRAYTPRLWALAHEVAAARGLGPMSDGVYVAMPGPSYETPAEVRMLQRLGADVVGMSLVPEVIALAHAGREVLALSVVANAAAGLTEERLTHADVTAAMAAAGAGVARLVAGIVAAW